MNTPYATNPSWDRWRQIYIAALFETDKGRLCQRIKDAEKAVVLRTRELFQSTGDHRKERNALEAALCALRALRTIYADQHPIGSDKEPAA
jgi:hypothetical protein